MQKLLNIIKKFIYGKQEVVIPKSFEETVRAMTGKEIVMAMVNGLLNGYYVVDMSTYGGSRGVICFGCAATNCITEISGIKFEPYIIDFRDQRCDVLDVDYLFLDNFENAIDELRSGDIIAYNGYARIINIKQLPETDIYLPILNTLTWHLELQSYIDYANTLT